MIAPRILEAKRRVERATALFLSGDMYALERELDEATSLVRAERLARSVAADGVTCTGLAWLKKNGTKVHAFWRWSDGTTSPVALCATVRRSERWRKKPNATQAEKCEHCEERLHV